MPTWPFNNLPFQSYLVQALLNLGFFKLLKCDHVATGNCKFFAQSGKISSPTDTAWGHNRHHIFAGLQDTCTKRERN